VEKRYCYIFYEQEINVANQHGIFKTFVFTHLVLSGLANWYNDRFIQEDIERKIRIAEREPDGRK